MTIDSFDLNQGPPALSQDVWEPAKSVSWADIDVIVPYPAVDCGPMTWTLVDQLDNPIDLAIFTPDVPVNPKSVSVYTEDSVKVGSYPLRVKVVYDDHPENPGAQKDFSVEITDSCETAYTITAPPAPLDVSYTVARPTLSVPPFDDFVVDPVYCPLT